MAGTGETIKGWASTKNFVPVRVAAGGRFDAHIGAYAGANNVLADIVAYLQNNMPPDATWAC